jgi:tetratricopeptide (TPR) repeat protein/predicted Ser/Thr protein kinase
MALMTASRICGGCGAEVPDNALEGLCPNCVAPLAFAVGVSSQPVCPVVERERLHYVGDYELLEEIARGGMGVVYTARQVSLNRIVAVKMILTGKLASPGEVRRFRAEAEAAATLQHPNIVAIHEIGEDDGLPYFSMDFIEGRSLRELVREGPMPAKRGAALMKTAAEAIHYAHQRGVLHRDLKPSNIVLDILGQPHITDFGLAKQFTADAGLLTSDLTLTGQILGTPSYMSPEQVIGKRQAVGAASDLYSLGAIFYFLITGRPPFQGETLQQVFEQVTHSSPLSPRLLNPALPRDLETICLKCLQKEPSKRYASAAAFAEDLNRFLRDEPILARPTGTTAKMWRWCRRHVTVTVSAFLIVALVAGFSWRNWRTLTELRNTAPSLVALARSLADAQRFPEALERMDLALQLQPLNADYLLFKGDLLQAMLRLEEARGSYARALAIEPSLSSARENLKLCDKLLTARQRQSRWTMEDLTELYNALLGRDRSAEAYAVARRLDAAKGRFVQSLQVRLNQAGITNKLGWSQHRPAGLGGYPAGSPKRFKPGSRNYLYLNLDFSDIADLSPLRGIPLQELSIMTCRNLVDLRPLQGMPLVRLRLSFGKVADLSPLAASPLEVLELSFNDVQDLGPLRSIRTLRSLNLANVDVSDLSPLKGLPLEVLGVGTSLVSSLEPLRDMRHLTSLGLGYVKVTDLRPLAGLQLRELQLEHLNVADISPLRGLPLQILYLSDCPLITDLWPLKDCKTLQRLVLPPNARDIEFLRHFPNLREISYSKDGSFLSAGEFWKAYDDRKNPHK